MIAPLRSSAAAMVAERSSTLSNPLVVATDPAPEFDPGPLSWVHREIDHTLAQGLESLAAFSKPERDVDALKAARMHVHQALGAFRMVGLDAVAEFAGEIERVLGGLEGAAAGRIEAISGVVHRACRKLSIFLGELASGAAPAALKLYPEYEAMQRSRGVEAVTPTDLFYPDLRIRAPRVLLREAIPADKLPSHLAKKRRLYESGLLLWLRGDAAGARTMREAVAGIEAIATQENLRSFWWTVRALLEALAERGLECRSDVKQLAARIDLQIRRVLEGSAVAADRLRREVLYHVAISAPVGPTVRAVQRAFRLASFIPAPDAIDADLANIEPQLREGRERLVGIKETWLTFASGRTENLAKVKQALTVVHAKATELRHGALTELAAALLERLNGMPAGPIPEPLAMEFTTALLLAEGAFENYANLSTEFPHQVQAMLARLDAAAAGRPAPGDTRMLGNLGERAQERMLLAQVGHEIRANLHRMEEVLDEFFRDETKRSTLASLAKDSREIHGALRILGLDDADRLLTLCDERVQAYASPETDVSSDELELLAESLCGLEFYFEAVELRRRDAQRLIAPLLARWLGETPPQPVEETESVESAVAALRAELPRLVEQAYGDRNDAQARDELKARLANLKDDAELIGDEELAIQVEAAIAKLERSGHDLAAAVQAIAGTSTWAPEISEETQRLLEVDATGRDAGLLAIYLTEAAKVLAAIGEGLGALLQDPNDRQALDTVRRGFHTLKESGRMVGLSELADLAGEVEAIHNRLLEKERPVTATVVAMIDTAQAGFRGWVDELHHTGRVAPDASKLHAALRVVDRELSPVASEGPVAAAKSADVPVTPVPITVPSVDGRAAHPANVGAPRIEIAKPAAKGDIWSVALVQPASSETLAGIRDEIDADWLARFVDEATELLPAARNDLRAWHEAPSDKAAADQLRRTLHTFKGGARMAGAMRLGHLLQSMESRLVVCEHRAAPPELFQALGSELDLAADVLDKLIAGESNVALPRLGAKLLAEAKSATRTEPASAAPKAPVAEHPIVASAAASGDDKIEVLKTNLDETTERMATARSQLREIEAQGELQMRARMTELHEVGGECDSSELDALTRVQDLTDSLSEVLSELATVQQSLLRHLDEASATLRPQQRAAAGHLDTNPGTRE